MVDVRPDWLNTTIEAVVEPDLAILDPHHHLWEHTRILPYTVGDLHADTRDGHNVVGTVFVECSWAYRIDGDADFAPVGETEYVAGVAPGSVIKAIVGSCDLTMPADKLREVLAAHDAAGNGLFRGIRHRLAVDPTGSAQSSRGDVTPVGLAGTEDFRRGVALLGELGYTFDAWLYHPQIPELTAMARATPATTIILDHIGAPLGIGTYANRRAEVMEGWQRDITELATCANVVVKVGGIGMVTYGSGFEFQEQAPTSDQIVDYWGDALNTVIDLFGAERCMFESNFPVDKVSCSYRVLWNAFKKTSVARSATDRAQLFEGTAARVYMVASA